MEFLTSDRRPFGAILLVSAVLLMGCVDDDKSTAPTMDSNDMGSESASGGETPDDSETPDTPTMSGGTSEAPMTSGGRPTNDTPMAGGADQSEPNDGGTAEVPSGGMSTEDDAGGEASADGGGELGGGGTAAAGGEAASEGCSFLTDFSSPLNADEWLVLGEAERNSGGWLEMTNNQQQVAGGIALVGIQVSPGDLDVSFKVSTGRCSQPGECPQGGEVSGGFAVSFWNVPSFRVQSLWDDLIGHACLGYCISETRLTQEGLTEAERPEGFTVEFDTYPNRCPQNGAADPVQGPHVAVHLDGRYYTFDAEQENWCDHPAEFDGLWDPVPNLVDNEWHTARVIVNGNAIRTYFDGNLVVDAEIPAFDFKGGVLVFSGGSGAVPAYQRFDDLELRGQACGMDTEPSSGGSAESGGGSTESGGGTAESGGAATESGGETTESGGGSTESGGTESGGTESSGGATESGGGATESGGEADASGGGGGS